MSGSHQVIAWDEKFELGNELIDHQHKTLFELVNNLSSACEDGSDVEKLDETLSFLVNYTVKHFSDEEELQVKYKYPGYEAHKKIHDDFKMTVSSLVSDFHKSGSSTELSKNVNTIVIQWLVKHILGEDRKIGYYLYGDRK